MMSDIVFFVLVFLLAVLYSSVGHGGASGYLALMALFSFPPDFMRPTALVLNIFVSSIAFYSFYRGGHFKLKLLLPFIITSLPFAYFDSIKASNKALVVALSSVLFFAGIKLIFL